MQSKLPIYKNIKTLTGQYVRNYCQFIFVIVAYCKNSLKIPKGKSESVNRRTDNTMVKRKKDNRTNKNLQNTTQKTKERTTRARTPLKQGVNSGRVNISCFTSGTRRIAQVTNPVISDE